MENKEYNVAILGCGKIFPRHIEAIEENENFSLVCVCDIDSNKYDDIGVKGYKSYKKMYEKENFNFVVIATPNGQHFEQASFFIEKGCDVLIEKPATLDPQQIDTLNEMANDHGVSVYAVLQVRLNSCIQNLKKLIDENLIGDIRGISLVQRWQRPKEYFDDWRGQPLIGGGILHECGIHYLDIVCYLFGRPNVIAAKQYNTKHLGVPIEDTMYSIVDFDKYGGTVEVNISSEPKNIECSLMILTSEGHIKLGGKAMNVIEEVKFLTEEKTKQIKNLLLINNFIGSPNSYGSYSGSCPNHPKLYEKLNLFTLRETKNVLFLIDEIYQSCNIKYY